MKKNKLFQSLNDIDETLIEEAGQMKDFKKKIRFNPIEFLVPLVAVAIIMIIVLPTIFNRDVPPGIDNGGGTPNNPETNRRQTYNDLIEEPDYENAQYRADIGSLFYETDQRIGFSSSFGIFIYNIKTEKLETAIRIDTKEAFGEEYFPDARMKLDGQAIYISAFSDEGTFSGYHYEYSLMDGNLYRVDGLVQEEYKYPFPEEKRMMEAFDTKDWTIKDFKYNPIGSGKPLYPFKDIDIKLDESSKESIKKNLTQIENQEYIVKKGNPNDETIISFGKSFINLYNGAVSKRELVSFKNYITNKNLLNFADKMLELTIKQELKGGTGVNYGLRNEFEQAKIISLEENVYYLQLPFEYEGSRMTCKMIITSADKTLKLVDFYFGNKDGVDTLATGHQAVRKINDPNLWEDKDWVKDVFDKLKELEIELDS